MTSPVPHHRRRALTRVLMATATVAVALTTSLAASAPSQAATLRNPVAPKAAPRTIEVASPYIKQVSCDPKAKPGVSAFYNQMISTYKTGRSLGIVSACSKSGGGSTSEHKEGRAVDWGLRITTAKEKQVADQFIAWALAKGPDGKPAYNARRMGIMYMIWNKRIWGSYNSSGWRPYSGANPHTDHIHVSFAWNGAMKRTSWWTGKAAAVDFGPCRASGSSYAPIYRAANLRPCSGQSVPKPSAPAPTVPKPAPKPVVPAVVKAPSVFGIAASGTNPVTVSGQLILKTTKKPLAAQAVTLRVKWQGTSVWANVAALKTNATGRVSYNVTSTRPGYYQYVYAGTKSVAAVGTATPLLKAVIPPRVNTYFGLNREGSYPVEFVGTLWQSSTGKGIAGKAATFQVMYQGTDKWVHLANLTTDANGKVSYKVYDTRPARYSFAHAGSATTNKSGSAARFVTPVKPKAPEAPKGYFQHYVVPGDTLRVIADKYDVHRSELRYLNRLADDAEPKVGSWVLVPTKDTHDQWHRGDSR